MLRTTPIDDRTIEYFRTKHPVISKLFAKGEAALIADKDPYRRVEYALDIIHGRWPEAEPAIMKDPTAAMNYANEVLRSRWPEAEPVIKADKYAWEYYIRFFPAAETKRSR